MHAGGVSRCLLLRRLNLQPVWTLRPQRRTSCFSHRSPLQLARRLQKSQDKETLGQQFTRQGSSLAGIRGGVGGGGGRFLTARRGDLRDHLLLQASIHLWGA